MVDPAAAAACACALSGHNFLLLGQAGVGKTCLLKKIREELIHERKKVAMTATTGLASSLLIGGETIHRFCGIMDGRFSNDQVVERIRDEERYSINVSIK